MRRAAVDTVRSMATDGWEFWKVTTADDKLLASADTSRRAGAVIDREKSWTRLPKLRGFIANWFVTENFV